VSQTADPLGLLECAIEQAGRPIARTRADQARLPTPCSEFDLRALVNHIVYDVRLFTAMLTGAERALHLPFGERPATWALGQHTTDLVMNSWDVATATGQSTNDFDPELARVALDWARDNLTPQLRGRAFGPEVAVPETAPIYDRLVGFFGRDPAAFR